MSYSWEGRCYTVEHGNQSLTNIYLTFDDTEEYRGHFDTIQNKIGSKILGVEKSFDMEYKHVTLIVKTCDRDEVIAEVENFFKYV